MSVSVEYSAGSRELCIKDIQVECSDEEVALSELDGLKLILVEEQTCCIDLERKSKTLWRQKNNVAIPISGLNPVLIVSADVRGDLGHVLLNLVDRLLGLESSQVEPTRLDFEPVGDGPKFSLLASICFDNHETTEEEFEPDWENVEPSELYDLVESLEDGDAMKAVGLNLIGLRFLNVFNLTHDRADIASAIEALDKATTLVFEDDAELAKTLNRAGCAYCERFKAFGQIEDINEAIIKGQMAIAMTPDDDEDMPNLLDGLGAFLLSRFQRVGELSDISEAIKLQQDAVNRTTNGHPALFYRLNNLAGSFFYLSERTGDLSDIAQTIKTQQQAANLTPPGHPNLPGILTNLGVSFFRRFKHTGDTSDISEAIQLQRKAVKLAGSDQASLPILLTNLGNSLSRRFGQTGELSDISEAIQLHQQAASLTPKERADLPGRLNNIGGSFLSRFKRAGNLSDIHEAIRLQKAAIELIQEGDVFLPIMLTNLGESFLCRFEQTGELSDISESIQLRQTAIKLTPEGSAEFQDRLILLGASFLRRFEGTGELSDISESIRLMQVAVKLTPDEHIELPGRLNNLAYSFLLRFEETRELSDVLESIELGKAAMKAIPSGHSYLPGILTNLGRSFVIRFEHTGELSDLSESIDLWKSALELTPDGHPELNARLRNLGSSLALRFERTGDLTDISESIRLLQQALKSTPDGHPELPSTLNSLGIAFSSRFKKTGDVSDILESTRHHQQVVKLTPLGHAALSKWHSNLGSSFLSQFERTLEKKDAISAVSNFRSAAMSSTGTPVVALSAARLWARLAKKSSLLPPSELLEAHKRIMYLISHLAGFSNTVKRRYELLANASELSTAAAAAALSLGETVKALEWLEQGHCIVWNQINQLRSPVDSLRAYNPDFAARFLQLSKQLEIAGSRIDPRRIRKDLSMDAKISLQEEAHSHLMLAKERDDLLSNIRKIPHFESFLLPRTSADLMESLPEDGPVVLMNVHEDHCDALVLMSGCDQPMHVPLERFSYRKAKELAEALQTCLLDWKLRSRYTEDLKMEAAPRGMRRAAKRLHASTVQEVLQTLWADLVEPILGALAMIKDDPIASDEELPRIWWCPTGPLAFLPIHAAGIYDEEASKDCLANFAISSYIPTLSILQRLKSRTRKGEDKGVLLINQPDTPGLPRIPCTTEEIGMIKAEVDKRRIPSTLLARDEAVVSVIGESLESFSCIHVACHASQSTTDPLESAIHLYDASLKLSQIIQKDLPNADLAFLSACQTSTGDSNLPEEAVHLAAGMLAAGYRSVIATMWSISDRHAPEVAETFYKNLPNDESVEGRAQLDITGSARALHVATQRLRNKVGYSTKALLEWMPYVHFGI